MVGLAGAVAALSVTAYSLRQPAAATDPASEIRKAAPSLPPSPPAATADRPATSPSQAVQETSPRQPPAASTDPAPSAPRAVAPSIVAVPPVDPSTLERVDARPPLSDLAAAPPPKKPPPKPLLFQPVAQAAGVIAAGGRVITISGVELVPDEATCARPGGGQWPCGRAARTAFRAMLRGRAVTCDFPEGEVPDPLSTSCRVGQRDIAAWLVENGWARASGDAFAAQADLAKAQGRGIFGKGPDSLPAEASTPTAEPTPPIGADGPAEISILPDSGATGATASEPSASTTDTVAGPQPSDPLPPPATPSR